MFNAQELNHLIEFQELTVTRDQYGGEIESWETVATAYAKVEPLVGREFFAAAAVQAENTVKFTLRYRSDLNTFMRLVYDGDDWNMTSVIDIKGRHRETLVMAERID